MDKVVEEAGKELEAARVMHSPMKSTHDGWAVIYEELDELWDEVRKKHPDPVKLRKEAIQVAAMVMRFVTDVVEGGLVG